TTTTTKAEPKAKTTYNVKITCPLANIRQHPALTADVVRQEPSDALLSAVDTSGEWTELQDGTFVLTRLVERC
ncbi:MAG: hypothetical protein RR619_02575, partial [Raoultibacter sp.]